jgi:hypothetical protein
MNQTIGFNSIVRTNGTTITYAYNQINDTTGVVEKSNIQESFVLLPTDTDLVKANNTILDAINKRLNPITQVILGSVTIKYVDSSSNLLEPATTFNNLPMGLQYFTAKSFSEYTISGNIMQAVTLSSDNPNQTITFIYAKNEVTQTTPTA